MSLSTTRKSLYVDFGTPPPGYVPGLGRGAVGFTTKMDIATARFSGPQLPGASTNSSSSKASKSKSSTVSGVPGQFDDAVFEAEDAEADAIWAAVDAKVNRHTEEAQKRKDAAAEAEESQRGIKLHAQFADLRRELTNVTVDEWESIPEVGQVAYVPKQTAGAAAAMPVPDSVLRMQVENDMFSRSSRVGASGLTPAELAAQDATTTDLRKLGEARASAVSARLDVAAAGLGASAPSGSGNGSVNAEAYLQQLESQTLEAAARVADDRKLRELLTSLRATYSEHAPSWIAAARLEEAAGKMRSARKIALEGCGEAPDSADMWLEAARLCQPDEAKRVLARAASRLPRAVEVWMAAARLEMTDAAKRTVYRKALEANPTSAVLWKAAVQLEPPHKARVLLTEAVKCVPADVDLWLALARLQSYGDARETLNAARAAVDPDSLVRVWVAVCRLEEARAVPEPREPADAARDLPHPNVAHVAQAAVTELASSGIGLALASLFATPLDTAAATEAAERYAGEGLHRVASAVLARARGDAPDDPALWARAAALAPSETVRLAVLRASVSALPTAPLLWLMAAKAVWQAGELGEARQLLAAASAAVPRCEPILLAGAKLETLAGAADAAGALLARARAETPSARVWVKSAVHARMIGDAAGLAELLASGRSSWPDEAKLWMMAGQSAATPAEAAAIYRDGLRAVPTSAPLWLLLAQTQVDEGKLVAARATLERGREALPSSDEVLEGAAKIEMMAGNREAAGQIVAEGLAALPRSGRLWVLAIELEPPAKKRSRAMDAVKAAKSEARILTYVARLFMFMRLGEKAKAWLQQARKVDSSYGDAWAWAWAIGSDDERGVLEADVRASEPRYGEAWIAVAKADSARALGLADVLQRVGHRCAGVHAAAVAAGVFSDPGALSRLVVLPE
ncbi:RNA splicing factor [Thecamonas trahens ATCC 50062]|uniref:RNA splicing factor n=1 Tax=Thecamonas trahens ATCC 50062 TaxID=461836 RepID=A0A0L0DAL9_THETB|nr:RNA splicing factor [Thecamonas trahens ATCC 50062]KNC48343.1 RNA splicing factor [Thecamonas trahens ATCC 50062]|eukprot:XP_013758468.1 RNA splicing factor [Thecamonas trahens ATCC 50062]